MCYLYAIVFRRQESMYTKTGLYSETVADDSSSVEMPAEEEEGGSGVGDGDKSQAQLQSKDHHYNHQIDTIIKCHSREPSNHVIMDRSTMTMPTTTSLPRAAQAASSSSNQYDMQDCGMLACYPKSIQKFARIKVFVFLLSMLVTLQQALSSGYINSVITTIEKRFEIPSSYSGLIASSYEIGNVITVIFVSYLGSRRHIPVWIGIGAVIMGIGSLVFMVPHFTGEQNPGIVIENKTAENICSAVDHDMGLGRLSNGVSNPALAPHNNIR